MTVIKSQEELAIEPIESIESIDSIEELRRKLAAVTLELRNTQLDLMDTKDDLESSQADLDAALSNLEEKELELKNTKLAPANSEYARQVAKVELDKELSSHAETKLELKNIKGALVNSERAHQEANRDRVMPRTHKEQEVFIVVKFQIPQPRFRIFAMKRQTVDRVLKQFFADHANLDPIEIKKLRFDPSPRGENVIQHMRRDKDAPIKLTNRSFVLRDNNDTEPEMIEYITKVFNTYTDNCSEAAVVSKSE
ncbi:hypothetical protein BX616_000892 [Lobosporangium transversale]|uniref:Uncharacterized protein n=1 Tax=Lobosporangium transversale TaxID=64571 RepID=A0A1Y2G948_9FUNG|nr:hypothetical protein BCR41DRAFT_390905 [Lobosporangium transversale]KAF9905909.1 hypothetical protein BX616_000892 [Lobosporangium transversale]ORY94292.1 hypothetical protein BCR41DRAFT_390905 [Lobosporangium transversale]|eukprot:XP_021875235.1 hypothetical protein BCR41DRAFT_390905 [Lobosporangium transversale]